MNRDSPIFFLLEEVVHCICHGLGDLDTGSINVKLRTTGIYVSIPAQHHRKSPRMTSKVYTVCRVRGFVGRTVRSKGVRCTSVSESILISPDS